MPSSYALASLALTLVAAQSCSKASTPAANPPDAGLVSAGPVSLTLPPGFTYEPDAVMKILDGLKAQSPSVLAIARSYRNERAQQRLTITSSTFPSYKSPSKEVLEQTVARTIVGLKAQGLTVEIEEVVPSADRVTYRLIASAGTTTVATRGIVAFDTEKALHNWAVTCSVLTEKREACTAPLTSFAVDADVRLQTFDAAAGP